VLLQHSFDFENENPSWFTENMFSLVEFIQTLIEKENYFPDRLIHFSEISKINEIETMINCYKILSKKGFENLLLKNGLLFCLSFALSVSLISFSFSFL
jgi:hypothetical protein